MATWAARQEAKEARSTASLLRVAAGPGGSACSIRKMHLPWVKAPSGIAREKEMAGC